MLICGDCLEVMRGMEDESVDLIMTSPPYGNQRKSTYGGIDPDKYVDWFLPRSEQMMRVLRTSGSFVLNIKEHVEDGERHPYVLHLILALREQGWHWVDEYIWHKTNCFPGGDVRRRLKDGWERVIHFTRKVDFKFNPDNVLQKASIHTLPTSRQGRNIEDKLLVTANGSGHYWNPAVMKTREYTRPSNVISLSPDLTIKEHSAVFPKKLPMFFVKLFTDANDVVLDPFCGSGTTMVAAHSLGRRWIGIDKEQSSIDISRDRLAKTQPALIPA